MIPSCSKHEKVNFKHKDGLYRYFEEIHKIVLGNKTDYKIAVFPISGCSDCLFEKIEKFLSLNNKADILYIVGDAYDKRIDSLIKLSQGSHRIIFDHSGEVAKYNANIKEPYFFHILNGEIHLAFKLNIDNINVNKKLLEN
jgi:hypothetical protein